MYNDWNNYWKGFKGYTFVGSYLLNKSLKTVKKTLDNDLKIITKDAKILDIGCGTGRTLEIFRNWGYSGTIGIDNSEESIRLCEKRGFVQNKDVFIMDGTKTTFNDSEFELVFSEGILEHFNDFSEFVREMARINSKYILLIQPNHFSFIGKIINFLENHLVQNVREISYIIDDFRIPFEKLGYNLMFVKDTPYKDFWILVFEKNDRKNQS